VIQLSQRNGARGTSENTGRADGQDASFERSPLTNAATVDEMFGAASGARFCFDAATPDRGSRAREVLKRSRGS
jgi:hypothetical protein